MGSPNFIIFSYNSVTEQHRVMCYTLKPYQNYINENVSSIKIHILVCKIFKYMYIQNEIPFVARKHYLVDSIGLIKMSSIESELWALKWNSVS